MSCCHLCVWSFSRIQFFSCSCHYLAETANGFAGKREHLAKNIWINRHITDSNRKAFLHKPLLFFKTCCKKKQNTEDRILLIVSAKGIFALWKQKGFPKYVLPCWKKIKSNKWRSPEKGWAFALKRILSKVNVRIN